MNKYLYYILVISLTLSTFSCKKADLKVFGDEHHIYFDKFYKDAVFPGKDKAEETKASFFFLADNVKELEVPLVVHMTGRLLKKDLPFQLKVDPKMTTANADEYKLEDLYHFRANNVSEGAKNQSDTIYIKMFKTERLKDLKDGVKLTLDLVPVGDLQLGQTERTKAVIVLTRDAIKPAWWTEEVSNNLFGTYSSRKYKLFLLNIDPDITLNEDMLRENPSKAIYLVREYKKWLSEHPDEAVEEDGTTPITVNV